MTSQPKVLIIEDDASFCSTIVNSLQDNYYKVSTASNGGEAIDILSFFPADLIVMDISIAETSGYDICKQLKVDSRLREIFLLLISPRESLAINGTELFFGVDDFIESPFAISDLKSRIENGLQTVKRWRQGTRDEDTGLFNRSFFNMQLSQEYAIWTRGHSHLCLVLMRIDAFQDLQESLSQTDMQWLKKAVGESLIDNSRVTDTCALWNHRDFVILLRSTPIEGAQKFCEKIRKKMKYSEFPDHMQITVSLGVAELRESDAELVRRVSLALQKAELRGGNQVISAY